MSEPANHAASETRCTSCGATLSFAPRALSTRCGYCDSPNVDVATAAQSVDRVAPFRIERSVACTKLREWLSDRWFAPEALRQLKVDDGSLEGLLVPAWVVDGVSECEWQASIGIVWYRTEHYTDSEGKRRTRSVREVDWSSASGGAIDQFEDHVSHAGGPISSETLRRLPAFDLGFARDFDERWVSGFVAYAPDQPGAIPRDQIVNERKGIARARVESQLLPGDENRLSWIQTKVQILDAERVLLPLWRVRYMHKGTPIDLWVHGQSGECLGAVPTSSAKVVTAILTGILLVALAVLAKEFLR